MEHTGEDQPTARAAVYPAGVHTGCSPVIATPETVASGSEVQRSNVARTVVTTGSPVAWSIPITSSPAESASIGFSP